MMGHLKRQWKQVLVAGAVTALVAGLGSPLPSAYAGGTIKADDDKWISIGMGIRTSFNAIEGASPGGHYSNDFVINNARIYINGQIHKYVKFEFNTDCFNCQAGGGAGPFGTGGAQNFGGNSSIGLLDAVGKFEFNEMVNLWVGRMLLPSERGELNGPFYHATFDGFRTPFFPADLSANFNGPTAGGGGAGLYGRDNAATFWGKVHPFGTTHLLYVLSVSQGLRNGPNLGSSLMYTGRVQWNFLNDEPNPGYYTSGTYYGTAGDIAAVGVSVQHQKDGAGNAAAASVSDFTGASVDVLLEKVLPNNMGVFTFNGEFKRHWANYGTGAFAGGTAAQCFCTFNGHSWTVYGLYLIPHEVGIGRFQPYVRFTSIDPLYSAMRQEWETGVNYIIAGHNARISAFYRYGDLNTKGFFSNFGPNASGNKVDSFHVALQLQY